MKIGIHHRKGSFSDRWVAYCKQNKIPFKIVNCYETNIIEQLNDCTALMWHHSHSNYKDILAAKPILFSLEQAGVKVFPDFNTAWHFDDKVAQKYLLESIGAPTVPSYVFYDKEEANNWIKKIEFPKVFKLKGGAGSMNVKLVYTAKQAHSLVRKAFGKGFSHYNFSNRLNEKYRLFKKKEIRIKDLIKFILHYLIKDQKLTNMLANEKGYVYFQEFIPENNSDTRVVIVNNKAFAIKRMVRDNDFRASGSGCIIYEKKQINKNCIKIAFEVNSKIKSQSIAFDFVFGTNETPLIVEISYGYSVKAYDSCPGYWDSELKWHEGQFNPQEWMLDNLIQELKMENARK